MELEPTDNTVAIDPEDESPAVENPAGDGGSTKVTVQGIQHVMDQLVDQTVDHDEVQVQDILEAFDGRLFGPAILLPAVIAVTPLGAIPAVPTLVGCFIILIASQQLLGRPRPWVPGVMRRRGVPRAKMVKAFDRFRPWARRIDKLSKPRLSVLVEGPMTFVIAAIVVMLACLMPPLEFIPFAVLPASAVLMFGLALVGRDGLLASIGLTLSVVSAGAITYWLVF